MNAPSWFAEENGISPLDMATRYCTGLLSLLPTNTPARVDVSRSAEHARLRIETLVKQQPHCQGVNHGFLLLSYKAGQDVSVGMFRVSGQRLIDVGCIGRTVS